MVSIAKANADFAGVFSDISFSVQDATKSSPPTAVPGFVVSNPPYGERLGELTSLIPLFNDLGKRFKEAWKGWHVTLLSSNRDLLRVLKLRASKDYAMNNGKLECRLVNYALNEENVVQFNEDAGDHEFANRLKKNLKRLPKLYLCQIYSYCQFQARIHFFLRNHLLSCQSQFQKFDLRRF